MLESIGEKSVLAVAYANVVMTIGPRNVVMRIFLNLLKSQRYPVMVVTSGYP